MKCVVCNSYSFSMVCKRCQQNLLTPSLFVDEVLGIKVISFYVYDEIKELLHTKYESYGSKIFAILAINSFAKFAYEFIYDGNIVVLPIDDKVQKGYSHTAILAKSLNSKIFTPKYGKLRALSDVKYANKNLEFKLNNPRNFICTLEANHDVVFVDDVVTDAMTIKEAKKALELSGNNLLFVVALTYSKRSF